MEPIALYLKKFDGLGRNEALLRRACREAVRELFSVEIRDAEIELRSGAVFFRVAPALRSEIFLRKEKLAELVLRKFPGARARTFR